MNLAASAECGKNPFSYSTGRVSHMNKPDINEGGVCTLIQEAPQITRQWVGVLHPPTGRGSAVDYPGLKNNWTCLEDLFSFDPENAWLKKDAVAIITNQKCEV